MAFNGIRRPCILLVLIFFARCIDNFVRGEPRVPCYFIFGDSLADCGNNNKLSTRFRANYPPYGVDFPKGPTGRYTNGRTVVDVIGELLGFDEFIPPFANLTGADILKGVNYASSASGIRNETGTQEGEIVNLNKQLDNHFSIVSKIISDSSDESAAKQHLEKCIYIVITGNNDYFNNYLMPNIYPTSKDYTPQQYADVLAKQYSEQLQRLYSYGARKVAVFGVGLIGQTPEMMKLFGSNSSMVSDMAQLFSKNLPPLVNGLNEQLSGAKFTFINTTAIQISSAPLIGLMINGESCCRLVEVLGTCVPNSNACLLRLPYAFFDGFHPTEVVTRALAARAYIRLLPSDSSPYSIHELAHLS